MQGSTTGSVVANVETEAVISDSDIVSLIVTVGNVASLDKSAVSDDVDAEIVQQTRHCTGNENIYWNCYEEAYVLLPGEWCWTGGGGGLRSFWVLTPEAASGARSSLKEKFRNMVSK